MSFIWPAMLWFLVLAPLCILFYLRVQWQRRQFAARFGSLGFVQEAAIRQPGLRRHIPPALFLVGLTILLISLARPQAVVSLPHVEGTVILAFDVSGSMAADDLKPTRMEAAKAAARSIVLQQPANVLIGVVVFSDSGFSVQPPTNEQATVLSAIDRLVPERGTSLGNGILMSLNTISASQGQTILGETSGEPPSLSERTPAPTPTPTPVPEEVYTPAVIVLLSDGENNVSPEPLAVAQTAKERGVRIYTIGIGSAAGAKLHIEGFTVHTQLDEALLQQIAQITGGAYFNADSEEELHKIYDNIDPQWVIKPEKMEITSIFAGASILVILVGGALSLYWFGRLP
jgi:Ca-activated chloride channel homolog